MRLASALLILLLVAFGPALALAQEAPQSTRPAPSPERQREIRDSIRQRSRVRFRERDEGEAGGIGYEPDRALLMPRMERTAIFRIGVPGWLMRLGLRAGRDEFDSRGEYAATRSVLKSVRKLRVAAFADNGAYDAGDLLRQYLKYVRRRNAEPVLQVRAPGGGVQIHVKERRGKVRMIALVAYGDEGAAVIRLKGKLGPDELREALQLMEEAAEESGGVEVDTDV